MLYQVPELTPDDTDVVREIHAIRDALARQLRAPRRWEGGLRRNAAARAIQGSNTIEGYTVSHADAIAAVDAEILGHRRVLTYVLTA